MFLKYTNIVWHNERKRRKHGYLQYAEDSVHCRFLYALIVPTLVIYSGAELNGIKYIQYYV